MATIWTDGCLACGYGCDNPAHLNFALLVADAPLSKLLADEHAHARDAVDQPVALKHLDSRADRHV